MPSRALLLRGAVAAVVAGLVVYMLFLINGLIDPASGQFRESGNFSWIEAYVLADQYSAMYGEYPSPQAYVEMEIAVVNDLVKPAIDAVTAVSALGIVGMILWLVYGMFLARPRRPTEVPRHLLVWLAALGLLMIGGTGVAFLVVLGHAGTMIRVQAQIWALVAGGAIPTLLFVAGAYLLTPSLLRPALPGAWLFGR